MSIKRGIRSALLILCFSSVLTACTDAEQYFEKCKSEALANTNAWAAYLKVKDEFRTYKSGSLGLNIDDSVSRKYFDLAKLLFNKALKEHNLDALNALANSDCSLSDNTGCGYGAQISESVNEFLVAVDKLPGKKSDIKYFMTAARVYQDGNWVLKDSIHAVNLYSRAWLAGSTQAPGKLWDVFIELKEPSSAYLWGIRCLKDCYINHDEISSLTRDSLTPKQITWIQQQAKDKSVITINGLAIREDLK